MMKLKILILSVLAMLVIQVKSQALIDLSKEEVKLIIKREYKDLAPDRSIVKQQFNYLKFVNRKQTRTLIVYFSKDDIAISSKFICDYEDQESVVADLDKNYTKIGSTRWEYLNKNIPYTVELKNEEWYFTVKEKKKLV
jgi:hypothetical protein